MWPDAQKFSDQFKKTTFDVIAVTTFDEVFKIAGAIAVTAAVGYISRVHGGPAAKGLFLVCFAVLYVYAGSRFAYFITGLLRRRDPFKVGNPWILYPLLLVGGAGIGALVNRLITELIAANPGL